MAKIGLQLPKYSILKDDETPTASKVLAKAVKADIKINTSDEKLYADDGVVENITEFIDGSLSLEVDDLSDDTATDLLGAKKGTAPNDEEIVYSVDNVSPYVKFGFIARRLKDNIVSYEANIFNKVKFSIPDEAYETKGKSVSFKTVTLTGTVMRDKTGAWKRKQTFASFELASEYIDKYLNPVVGG